MRIRKVQLALNLVLGFVIGLAFVFDDSMGHTELKDQSYRLFFALMESIPWTFGATFLANRFLAKTLKESGSDQLQRIVILTCVTTIWVTFVYTFFMGSLDPLKKSIIAGERIAQPQVEIGEGYIAKSSVVFQCHPEGGEYPGVSREEPQFEIWKNEQKLYTISGHDLLSKIPAKNNQTPIDQPCIAIGTIQFVSPIYFLTRVLSDPTQPPSYSFFLDTVLLFALAPFQHSIPSRHPKALCADGFTENFHFKMKNGQIIAEPAPIEDGYSYQISYCHSGARVR